MAIGIAIAGAVIGAGVGGFVAGGLVVGASLGWTIGTILGKSLFPKTITSKDEGTRLSDLKATDASYGLGVKKVFGRFRTGGNVIWAKPINEHKNVTTTQSSSKKSKNVTTTTTYTYSASFAVAFSGVAIAEIVRLWADGVLIYDSSATDLSAIKTSSDTLNFIQLYKGRSDQNADSDIQLDKGAANTPAFRDIAYMQFIDMPLADYGNRRPNITAEVVHSASIQLNWIPSPIANHDVLTGVGLQADVAYFDVLPDGLITVYVGAMIDQETELYQFVYSPFDGSLVFIDNWRHPSPAYVFPTTSVHDGRYIKNRYSGEQHNGYFINIYESVGIVDPLTWGVHRAFGTSKGGVVDAFPIYMQINSSNNYLQLSINGDKIFSFMTYNQSGFIAGVYAANTVDYAVGSLIIPTTEYGPAVYAGVTLSFAFTEQFIFILTSNNICRKFNFDGALLAEFTIDFSTQTSSYIYITYGKDGYLYAMRNSSSTVDARIDINTLEVVNVEADPFFGGLQGFGSSVVVNGMFYLDISQIGTVEFKISPYNTLNLSQGILVRDIVSALCEEAGMLPSDYSVASLNRSIHGMVVDNVMSTRSAIEPLMLAGLFDTVERFGKVEFVQRSGNATSQLTEDDIVAFDDGLIIRQLQQQEYELPKIIEITYADVDADYQDGSQKAERIVTSSNNKITIESPIAMTADGAKQLAEILLKNAWIERNKFEFKLTFKHIGLKPAHVVVLSVDGYDYKVRLTQVNVSPNGYIDCIAVAEESAYTSSATGTPIDYVTQTMGVKTQSILKPLDIPLLSNEDFAGNIYAVVMATSNTWAGSSVYRSTDGGFAYDLVNATSDAAVNGRVSAAMAAGSATTWDETTTIDISLSSGNIGTATDKSILNGSNAALIGNEIIQFVNVTDNGNGNYQLSRLLRGRRGTEWAIGSHVKSENFVLLKNLLGIPATYQTEILYKATTFGLTVEETSAITFTNTGIREKPFSPTHVKASRNGSNDLTITWINRSRYQAPRLWQIKLYEDSEAYQIDIMSGSTVLRSIAATTLTANYTAADQATDGLTPGDPVEINIYQLSAAVGRGYPENITI